MSKEERNTYKIESDENLGEVQIADEVVAIIAGLAAMEVEGVSSMAGNATRELIAKLGMKSLSKGVKVDVLEGIVTVSLALNLKYGSSIKDTTGKSKGSNREYDRSYRCRRKHPCCRCGHAGRRIIGERTCEEVKSENIYLKCSSASDLMRLMQTNRSNCIWNR